MPSFLRPHLALAVGVLGVVASWSCGRPAGSRTPAGPSATAAATASQPTGSVVAENEPSSCGPRTTGILVDAPDLDLVCKPPGSASGCRAVVPLSVANCTDQSVEIRRIIVRSEAPPTELRVDASGEVAPITRVDPHGTFVRSFSLGSEGRYVVTVEGPDGALGTGSFSLMHPPSPVLAAQPYLADEASVQSFRRAVILERGPLRFAPSSEPIARYASSHLEEPIEAIVAEVHEHTLRVVLSDGSIRLVVFVPREIVAPVSTRSVTLAVTSTRAPDPSASVRIAPGVVLEEKGRQGSMRLISGQASGIRFEGFIPEDAFGLVYTGERFGARGGTRGGKGLVAESTIVVTPEGGALATMPEPAPGKEPSMSVDVELVSGAPSGFQAIHLVRETIEVRGLVPTASFRKKAPSSFGEGRLHRAWRRPSYTDAQRAVLRAKAGLFDEHGNRVGVALADTQVLTSYAPIASDDRLRAIEVWVEPFGFVAARVHSIDLRPEGP